MMLVMEATDLFFSRSLTNNKTGNKNSIWAEKYPCDGRQSPLEYLVVQELQRRLSDRSLKHVILNTCNTNRDHVISNYAQSLSHIDS